jgi:hypothetical protein
MLKNIVVALMLFATPLLPVSSFAADPLPPRTGNILDLSHKLSPGTIHNLEASLDEYRLQDGIDLVAVITDPTDEMKTCANPKYNYAQELLSAWGMKDPAVVVVFFSDGKTLPMIGKTASPYALFVERNVLRTFLLAVTKEEDFPEERTVQHKVVIALPEIMNGVNPAFAMRTKSDEPSLAMDIDDLPSFHNRLP